VIGELGRLTPSAPCLGVVPGQSIAMSRMRVVALALIWTLLPARAAVLTLSCDGTMKEEEQEKPQAITKMGLIVNFDAGVITGFTGIIARIDEVNANSVLFKGTTIHPSGAEWSVRGTIDRITGSLGATVTWFNPKTNNLLMRMNYELTCKPT
jgi:hypothetical protein